MTNQLEAGLNEHFGFSTFRGPQKEIIKSILDANDTFVIMPTGGGKSLCYQLPALIADGTAIVISPLIALMKNQVDQVRAMQEDERIAHVLNSTLTQKQAKEVKEDISTGRCKIVYIAPETLVKEETIEFFHSVNLSFVAVDEAHCISEWGHDFRPEYRKIKSTIQKIGKNIPIIGLTATATPKVREDVIKNLGMEKPNVFVSSFLRDNLFYEVRPKGSKENVLKQIVQFINNRKGQSGVIYCLSRKSTEETAELLQANGINAAAYHAGLESGMRPKVQDGFLMDDIDVICATIAFGMGIDKPDVRYVIHLDIPKSIENYYQETGRAGRDGIESSCLAFFSHKDINKLEKFLKDKPIAEKEIAGQHLEEMASYAESAACRRKFLLHYFGEEYTVPDGGCGHCDNCKNPKEQINVKEEATLALNVVQELLENHTIPYLVDFLTGRATQQIKMYKHDANALFGKGKEKDKNFWNSIFRNLLLEGLLKKDIEKYGVILFTEKGKNYLQKPTDFKIALFHDFSDVEDVSFESTNVALDDELKDLLVQLRKKIAKKHQLQPTIIFLENSINDMATYYPITEEEMAKNVTGVSLSKAKKYGKEFIDLIKNYVEENDISRPTDFVMKSAESSSKNKIKISQQIDKQFSFDEIASNLNISRSEFLEELETIVGSGTKLNIDYFFEQEMEDDILEDIMEYFSEAETLDLQIALEELEPEGYTEEEIELVRLKYYNDNAN